MTHLTNSSTGCRGSRVAREERQKGGEHQRARDGNAQPVGCCQPIDRWKEDIRTVNADTRSRFSPFSLLEGHSRSHPERARYARERRTCFWGKEPACYSPPAL